MKIKKLDDFEVEECLIQFYQRVPLADARGNYGWWWHCITCNDASAKYRDRDRRRKKLRSHGHKTEADAMCGATMHAKQKRRNRQAKLWMDWWWHEVLTTRDIDYFRKLQQADHFYWRGYETKTDEETQEWMDKIQSDPFFKTKLKGIKRARRSGDEVPQSL